RDGGVRAARRVGPDAGEPVAARPRAVRADRRVAAGLGRRRGRAAPRAGAARRRLPAPEARRMRRGGAHRRGPPRRPARPARGCVVKRLWPWLRLLIGLGILAVLLWWHSTDAFVAALKAVDAGAVV